MLGGGGAGWGGEAGWRLALRERAAAWLGADCCERDRPMKSLILACFSGGGPEDMETRSRADGRS